MSDQRRHRFAAILLDLDGTILETLPDLASALNRLLAAEGRRTCSTAEVRAMIGDGVPKLVERGFAATGQAVNAEGLSRLVARFLPDYNANATVETHPKPGALEFCRAERAAGVKLAVVTNKPQAPSEIILAATDFAELMSATVGGDRAAAKKPDAAPIELALELLGVAAGDAVMIGDSKADVGAARAAGIPVAAYRHGYTSIPVDDLGADAVFDDFGDLAAVLARLC
jgi:phosphoglycolate phosphatase